MTWQWDGDEWRSGSKVVTAPPSGSRDPLQQPFASDSIWNMPLGSNAVYVNCNYTANPRNSTSRAIYQDNMLICLTPTAPQQSIRYNSNGFNGQTRCTATGNPPSYMTDPVEANVPIPTAWVVPSATDNSSSAHLMSNGRRIVQTQTFARCTAGGVAACSFRYPGNPAEPASGPDMDLYTGGILGSHGASRLSCLGGTMRLGEFRPGQSTGPRHVLKLCVDQTTRLYNANTVAETFRWPAVSSDSGSVSSYGSTISAPFACKMGSLLALPPSLNIANMGLETQPGFQLAWTLQNYGCYIVEQVGGSPDHAWCTEEGFHGSFIQQWQNDWGYAFLQRASTNNPWFRDWERILVNFHAIDNNSASSIGGGGTPRQPLAASIGTGP